MDVKEKSTKLIKIITLGAFFSFFLFGFSDNLKGATLPVLLDDLSFNYAYGGTILLLAYGTTSKVLSCLKIMVMDSQAIVYDL